MNRDSTWDARQISDEAMDRIRWIAVHAIRDRGYSPELISDVLQISRSSIYAWLSWYDRGGNAALLTRKAPGAEPKITLAMEIWLRHVILQATPSDFGYDTELWTIKIIQSLLEKNYGVHVCQATVANHLHRAKLSCQVPEYRAYGYSQREVNAFLEWKWPIIQRVAEKLGADILFEDESGIGAITRSGRTWGGVNSTPKVLSNDLRGGFNALSAISSNGDFYYKVEDGHIASDQYIQFLDDIRLSHPRPIVLVVDKASFHKSKKVRAFVGAHRKEIRVFFLPRHAPNMNPDEQVWNEIKHRRIEREAIYTKDHLKERLMESLEWLKNQADRIRSFFQLKDTKYALNPSAS